MLGEKIEEVIQQTVHRVLNEGSLPDAEYIATDNLGEVIEKLAIIHIRMWMLEDAIQAAKTDTEIAELKRKCDICFKVKRPKLVQAVNLLVDDAIANNKSLREDSVKLYKGIDNV
jgi:alpha-D-ribose 1-methylphosphonate 5-triphosphate synthase subunit PhnI